MSQEPRPASILPLRFDHVSFSVGGRALIRDLSLRLEPGSRTLILGPNGSGKSLTLRLAHGLLAPTSGSVRWEGPAAGQARRRQAMVFEKPVMLRRSALKNLEYALAIHGIPRAERRDLSLAFLEKTGLAPLANRRARVLSAGEQQRLAIARAWAIQPEVLFLDEPTASLDPGAARAVEELIQAIGQSGTKIVMTTHDLSQARRMADEILFLYGGQLLEQVAAAEFFVEPATDEARAFLRGELLW